MAEVPGGGSTGLLCRDYKGQDATAEAYKVDTALLAELLNHERRAAEELGQCVTKSESSTLNLSEYNRAVERRPPPSAGSLGKTAGARAGTQTDA